jgi:multicomponent K+:H+ antiporter subunit E
LLVHVFDMKNAEEEVQAIKNRYEKPLMEIFQ